MEKVKKKFTIFVLVLVLAQSACGTNNTNQPTETPPPPLDPIPTKTSLPAATSLPEPSPTPEYPPGYEEAMVFAGTWEGEWRNTTFGSSGPMTATCIPAMDRTITCTSDIGGMVFGVIDPDPQTFTLYYDEEGVHFDILDHPVFGEINGTLLFNGEFTGIAELIPDPGIASMEMSGHITLDSFIGTYQIRSHFSVEAVQWAKSKCIR